MTELHAASEAILHSTGLSIAARPLMDIPWLRHASTTRDFSTPDANRRDELDKVKVHLGLPDSFLVCGEQKHTTNIGVVTAEVVTAHHRYQCFQQTDALVCPLPDVTITIMTADCAPVFLVDPIQRIIALAHAGWKGTFGRIVSKTVHEMTKLDSSPANIIAWVGPMAGGCCYEVSPELIQQFRGEFSDWPVSSVQSERHLDLVEINCRQLENAGLASDNIHRSNLCTIHNRDKFYSYRADNGTHGRIISAMVMIP